MQTIDIFPTIADLIGVDIPWEVDGLAAGSERSAIAMTPSCSGSFPTAEIPTGPIHRGRRRRGFEEMLDMAYPPLDPDDPLRTLHDRSGYGQLVGRRFEPTGKIAEDTFQVDDLDRLLRTYEVSIVLTGTVAGGRVDEDAVAAIADGRIVAVSPVVHRNIGGSAFACSSRSTAAPVSASSASPSCAGPSCSTVGGSATADSSGPGASPRTMAPPTGA